MSTLPSMVTLSNPSKPTFEKRDIAFFGLAALTLAVGAVCVGLVAAHFANGGGRSGQGGGFRLLL